MATKQDLFDSESHTLRELMVYIENGVERDIKTVSEGVSTLLNRKPSAEEVAKDIEALEVRVSAVEAASTVHCSELNELKKAQ